MTEEVKQESVMLSMDNIVSVKDQKIERVEVPEWGGHVFVRNLSANERDALESHMIKVKNVGKNTTQELNLRKLRCTLASMAMCDAEGNRICRDDQAEELGKKNAQVIDRICDVARRLSGMRPEDEEELTKNSETTPEEDSTSS